MSLPLSLLDNMVYILIEIHVPNHEATPFPNRPLHVHVFFFPNLLDYGPNLHTSIKFLVLTELSHYFSFPFQIYKNLTRTQLDKIANICPSATSFMRYIKDLWKPKVSMWCVGAWWIPHAGQNTNIAIESYHYNL